MDAETTCQILSRAEINRLINLSLHGILQHSHQEDLARLAWAAVLNSDQVIEACGVSLGESIGVDDVGVY